MYFKKLVEGIKYDQLEGIGSIMGKCSDYCPANTGASEWGGCCNGHGYTSFMLIWIS